MSARTVSGRNGGTLRPFTKGTSGNPKGRPKKLRSLDELMAEVMGDDGNGKSEGKAILEAMIREAKKGDVQAATFLYDRGYGKPKQQVDMTGAGAIPVPTVTVVVQAVTPKP